MRRQPRATLGRGRYDDTAQESDRSLSGGALSMSLLLMILLVKVFFLGFLVYETAS